jgi:isopenicillin N synthase-like dioxygenase
MATNFLSVSVVDYALATDPATKPRFLADLQNALVNVGFLYLKNPPIAKEDMEKIVEYIPKLFDISPAAKQNIKLANSPNFLGYTGLGNELTKGKVDQREQFEFGTEYVNTWKPGDPEYLKMWGPAQVGFHSRLSSEFRSF